jgi:hypothetical protein
MATFAVIAEHPPDLCPTSNAQTRQMMKEGAGQIPQLAEQLGVNIVTMRILARTTSSSQSSRRPTLIRSGASPCRAASCSGTR